MLFGFEYSSSVTSNLLRPPRPHQTRTKENYHLKDTLRWKEGKKRKKGKKPRQPPIFHTSTSLTQKFFQNKKSILEAAVQAPPSYSAFLPAGPNAAQLLPKAIRAVGAYTAEEHLSAHKKGDLWNPKETKHTGSTQSNPLTLKRNYSVIKTGPSYCISSRQASLAAQQGCD